MGKLFGTDGIRGVAGEELTADLAYRLGLSLAQKLRAEKGDKPQVIIGKDTRLSGDMFEAALTAGLCAGGTDVLLAGIVPTPAVAYLTANLGADAGVMISASHNPSEYNGLKVFGPGGYKLSDETEEELEQMILGDIPLSPPSREIGRVHDIRANIKDYIAHIVCVLAEANPPFGTKKRVLLDLSNGSASATAKKIFSPENMYGWHADFIAYDPDGININLNCGSTQMDSLCELVAKGGYDLGIAFDGDADRCLLADERGRLINGDMIIARLAVEMKKEGKLSGNTVVVTKLTNLGFHLAAKRYGFSVAVTDVGDRYVLEEMLRGGYALGGEQSGHIILSGYATTGDGQLTAAKVLSLLAKYPEMSASELFSVMQPLPQVSVNVPVPASMAPDEKKRLISAAPVVECAKKVTDALGESGRLVLRPSGTEAVIRIMLEGENEGELSTYAEELKYAILRAVSETEAGDTA